MRRLLSIIPLLICLLWLAAGVSLETIGISTAAERSHSGEVELRSRIKGVKLPAPVCKLTRPAAPVVPVFASRVETLTGAPVVPVILNLFSAGVPVRPADFILPVPSRTGQIVIVV